MARPPKYISREKRKVNILISRETHNKLKRIKEEKRLRDFDAVICYLLKKYNQMEDA